MKKTVSEILEMAGTNVGEIGIKQHETGFFKLVVHVDDNGEIDDAITIDDFEEYYRSQNGEWHMIYRVGTGSCNCDCDACVNGDDPEDWADGLEFCCEFEGLIEEKIEELERELIDRQ